MKRFSWITWLRSRMVPQSKTYRKSPPPRLEELETRMAPATFTWTGTGANNNWSNNMNWIENGANIAPVGSAGYLADLVFPPGATQFTANNNLPLVNGNNPTFDSITISGSGYNLTGNPITLGTTSSLGSGFVSVNSDLGNEQISLNVTLGGPTGSNQFFYVYTGSTLTLTGQLSGTTGSSLTKEQPGTLILTNNNSPFTGPVKIDNNSGILQIQNPWGLGKGTSTTTVGSNSQLQLNNIGATPIVETLLLNGPGAPNAPGDGALLDLSGNSTWAGNIVLDSDSTFGVSPGNILNITGQIGDLGYGYDVTKEGAGQMIFSHVGGNTYRGQTIINNGILTIEDPLALGAGDNTAQTGTVVNQSITETGTLQLFDPNSAKDGGGFTIVNEQLILNGTGASGLGALADVQGNDTWAGNVLLGGVGALGSSPNIGVVANTTLTISGVVSSPNGAFTLTKVDAGELVLNNKNSYTGSTIVALGLLDIRDSFALGTETSSSVTVDNGAALALQTGSVANPLGVDSFTGYANKMVIEEPIYLSGTGFNDTGALHSINGINTWTGAVNLEGTAAIGVEPDPNASNTNAYFTSDYSLTVTGLIAGGNLVKVDNGQLILPNANTYGGTTLIQQGWITIRNTLALGGPSVNDLSPAVTVQSGAALMLMPFAGQNMNIFKNLVLSGTGITHPFALINQKGALESLGGDNSYGVQQNLNQSDQFCTIQLTGTAGIGVELADSTENPTSKLTIDSPISNAPGTIGGITKLGSQQLILENDDTYTGSNTISEGVLQVRYNTALGQASSGTSTGTETYTSTTTTVGPGIATVQIFTVGGTSGTASKPGTFTLTFNGKTTTALKYGASAAQVQAALNSLTSISSVGGSVTVTLSSLIYSVTFGGKLTGYDQNLLTARGSNGTTVSPVTYLIHGDGSALELESNLAQNGGGISTGLNIANEHLVLDSPGNTAFGDAPLTILSDDNLWSGPISLDVSTTIQIPVNARLILQGSIDDAANPSASGSNLTLMGGGELILGGINTYRGTTHIDQGVLMVANNQALGIASNARPDIQTLTVSGASGMFTLGFNGKSTGLLNIKDPNLAKDIQTDLNGLQTINGSAGSVTVSSAGNVYTVIFGGSLLGNQPALTYTTTGAAHVVVGILQVGMGGAVVANGASLELEGDLSLSGEPLCIEGQGVESSGTQTVNVYGTAGNFELSFNGYTTSSLNYNASQSDVQNALAQLTSLGSGNVTVAESGIAEVQTIIINGTSGAYTLGFDGQTTTSINYNDTGAVIQQDLDNILPSGDSVTVSPQTTANIYTITFGGNLDQGTQPLLISSNPALAAVTEATEGGYAYTVTFTGTLAGQKEPAISGTGAHGATVVVETQPADYVPLGWFSIGPSSTNNGNTATNQAVSGQVTGIVSDPGDPNIIYVAAGTGGAWKTINGGQTWQQIFDLPNGSAGIQSIWVNAAAGSYTLTFNGVTTDPLPYNATAEQVEQALDALSTVGGVYGSVQVVAADVQTITINETSGTYQLTFNGQQTVPISYNATALTVQTDLDNLSTIGGVGGSVSVNLNGNIYTVTFGGTLGQAVQPLMVSSNPSVAEVDETAVEGYAFTVTFGGALAASVQNQITAQGIGMANPVVSIISPGSLLTTPMYVGTIAMDPDYANILYLGTGEANNSLDSYYGTGLYKSVDSGIHWTQITQSEIQTVDVYGTTGTFTLGFNASSTTAPLPYNDTAADVQSALEGLSTIGNGNVTVTEGGIAEVQTITINGTSGTYQLTFNGQQTVLINYNDTALTVQTDLDNLSTIGGVGGSVNVTLIAGVYTVTFAGALGFGSQSLLVSSNPGLASVAEMTEGAYGYTVTFVGSMAGQNEPLIVGVGVNGAIVNVVETQQANPLDNASITKIIVTYPPGSRPNSPPVLYVADGVGEEGLDEVQNITISPDPTDTSVLVLGFSGKDQTGAVVYDSDTIPYPGGRRTALQIQNALDSLGNIGGVGGYVTVTSTGTVNVYQVTFGGTLGDTTVTLLYVNNSQAATTLQTQGSPSNQLGQDEVQAISVAPGTPSIILSFTGQNAAETVVTDTVTITLSGDSSQYAQEIQNGLDSLGNIGGVGGSVVVTPSSSNEYLITFVGGLSLTPLALLSGAQEVTQGVPQRVTNSFEATPGIWRFQNGAWFDLTGVVSTNRATVVSTQADAYASGAAGPYVNPPDTPGPDDNYLISFPTFDATWSDIALIYTDISNTGAPPVEPVIYAALGTNGNYAPGSFDPYNHMLDNGVFWCEDPSADTPIWYVGDPGGSPFSDPAVAPTGVDARNSSEFPVGVFPVPYIQNQSPIPANPLNGTIKLGAIAGGTLNSSTVYALVSTPTGLLRGVYVTTTGGQKWAATAEQPTNVLGSEGNYAITLLVSGGTIYVAGEGDKSGDGVDEIQESTNGGASWTDISTDSGGNRPAISEHVVYQGGKGLMVGGDGGIWCLEASGWVDLNGNLTTTQVNGVSSSPTNPTQIVAGTQSGLLLFQDNLAWTRSTGLSGGQVIIDPNNPNIIYAIQYQLAGYGSLVKSTDGGSTWTYLKTLGSVDSSTVTSSPDWNTPLVLDPLNSQRLLVGGDLLLESLDGGNTFINLTPNWNSSGGTYPVADITSIGIAEYQGPYVPDPYFTDISDLGSDTYDPATIYVTDGKSVFVTKDGGQSWVNRTSNLPGLGSIVQLVVDPRDRDTVYAIRSALGGQEVFLSTNAGQTWTDITYNLPGFAVWNLVLDPRTGNLASGILPNLYIGTDDGVWYLPSGSSTWQRFGSGMPNVQVKDLVLSQVTNTLLAGTFGRGAYILYLDDGLADAGALRAVSGSSILTGPVILAGDPVTNTVTISATGTQTLQNGVAAAQLQLMGPMSDAIAGSHPTLVKTGVGNLVLAGSNTYGGETVIQQGVLIVDNPQALGSPADGTIVESGTCLELESDLAQEPVTLNGDGFLFNGHFTGTLRNIANNNTYTGTLTLATNSTIGVDSGTSLTIGTKAGRKGVGTITDNNDDFQLTKELTGTLILTTANTYSGGTEVNAGALRLENAQALGSTSYYTEVLDGAQLQLQAPILTKPLVVSGQTLILQGTGIFDTGALLDVAGNCTWNGLIVLETSSSNPADATITFGTTVVGYTLTISGSISQSKLDPSDPDLGLTKVGAGQLTLTQADTYGGPTEVADGLLFIQNGDALGTSAAGATVDPGTALEVDGNALTVPENLTLNGSGQGGQGALINAGGNNTLNGSVILQSNTSVSALGGTTLTINGVVQDYIETNGYPPVPAATLTKIGVGTVVLASVNTYTGLTNVSGGILTISNSDALGGVVNEVQTVLLSGSSSGLFTLTFEGQSTEQLSVATETASGVQTALQGLSTIGAGNVTVTQNGSTYVVTFVGSLAAMNLPQITAIGYSGTTASVETLQDGCQGTLINSGATLELQGGIDVSTEVLKVSGVGYKGLGAIYNSSGTNIWSSPLTLAGNTTIGAVTGSQLTLNTGITQSVAGSAFPRQVRAQWS